MNLMLTGVLVGVSSMTVVVAVAWIWHLSDAKRQLLAEHTALLHILEVRIEKLEESGSAASQASIDELVEKYETKIAALERPQRSVRLASGRFVSPDALEEAGPEDFVELNY